MEYETMLRGFLIGAMFTSTDENDQPIDSMYGVKDFEESSINKAKEICKLFMKDLQNITTILETNCKDFDDLGINLWFTMAGQGANFLDWKDADVLYNKAKEVLKTFYVETVYVTDTNTLAIM